MTSDPSASFSIERTARVAASRDIEPAMRAEILRANELSEDAWQKIEEHWEDAVLADVQGGAGTLRAVWDDAYVERVEDERGPISVAEIAELSVAEERATVERVAASFGLPEDSLLPIQRVWQRRTTADPSLAARVKLALQAVREAPPTASGPGGQS